MNAHGDFVHERTLLVLTEAAQRLGIRVDIAHLAPTRCRFGTELVVPTAEYQAVLERIFADPRETLGIELAAAVPIEALGLWGFLLRTSPTFGAMLRRAERYIRAFFRYTRVRLDIRDDEVELLCEHPDPSPFGHREQAICFFLGQWMTLGRAFVGSRFAAQQVRMRWTGPVEPLHLETFFRCPVNLGCHGDDSIVFSRRICELPLPEHTPELSDVFKGYASAMIRRIGEEPTFVERVREALSEGLLSGEGAEPAVAQKLGMTKRTMRRHLAESGVTFRQIRSDLLRRRAERMLLDGRLPIAEISYLLGYAEPSTFHRAFRSWTGLSPGAWRERQTKTR
ncbi:MAG: AraC family transcriptional regulator ligand-binding domain-containing protein [Pseudomonadales bacterium]